MTLSTSAVSITMATLLAVPSNATRLRLDMFCDGYTMYYGGTTATVTSMFIGTNESVTETKYTGAIYAKSLSATTLRYFEVSE